MFEDIQAQAFDTATTEVNTAGYDEHMSNLLELVSPRLTLLD